MNSQVDLKQLKPGAVIVITIPVTFWEDPTVLFVAKNKINHAMIYTPTPDEVNNITHAVTGWSLCVKSHSLSFQVSKNSNEQFHIFNPKDERIGQAAAEQVKRWESFGLNYDVRKFNQGLSFASYASKEKDTIFSLFDPAHILKLVYRRFLPKARLQADKKSESGDTCHGLIMNSYNAAWMANELTAMKVDISPKDPKSAEYVSVKYARDAPPVKRPYYFPKYHDRTLLIQRQKENYEESKNYNDHPRGVHPFDLIPEDKLPEVIQKTFQCPFPCNPKYAQVSDLFALVKDSQHFDYLGTLDIKTVKAVENEKARAKEEAKKTEDKMNANRAKLLEQLKESDAKSKTIEIRKCDYAKMVDQCRPKEKIKQTETSTPFNFFGFAQRPVPHFVFPKQNDPKKTSTAHL